MNVAVGRIVAQGLLAAGDLGIDGLHLVAVENHQLHIHEFESGAGDLLQLLDRRRVLQLPVADLLQGGRGVKAGRRVFTCRTLVQEGAQTETDHQDGCHPVGPGPTVAAAALFGDERRLDAIPQEGCRLRTRQITGKCQEPGVR